MVYFQRENGAKCTSLESPGMIFSVSKFKSHEAISSHWKKQYKIELILWVEFVKIELKIHTFKKKETQSRLEAFQPFKLNDFFSIKKIKFQF